MKHSIVHNIFHPDYTEKEKVEGEDLQEWLKLVVAPAELTIFIRGKHENILQLKASS